jgi:mannose-6-phosphate isomerase-like protein (cupin superfamily)
MGYNPVVHGPKEVTNRQRIVNPRAGKRRSDRARQAGVMGVNVVDISNRESTSHGWRIPYYRGEEFEAHYEYFCANNGTGVLQNDKSTRVIKVLGGTLFVLTKGEINEFRTGDTIVLEAAQKYELSAPTGTDVELFVCQGAKYEENTEQIRDPEMTSQMMTTAMPTQKGLLPTRERGHRSSERTRRNAEAMQAQKEARGKSPVRKKSADPNSPPPVGAQTEGINLRPLGQAADRSQFEQPTGIPVKPNEPTEAASDE